MVLCQILIQIKVLCDLPIDSKIQLGIPVRSSHLCQDVSSDGELPVGPGNLFCGQTAFIVWKLSSI